MENLLVNLEDKRFKKFNAFYCYQVKKLQSRGGHILCMENSKLEKGEELYFETQEYRTILFSTKWNLLMDEIRILHTFILRIHFPNWKWTFNIRLGDSTHELKMYETYKI